MRGYLKSFTLILSISSLSAFSWAQDNGDAGTARQNSTEDYSPPPLTEFSAMIRRPLFTQKRRPANTSQVQTFDPLQNRPTQQSTKTSFLLSGIARNGDYYVALIKQSRTGEPLMLRKGDKISDWVVTNIKPEEVWLSLGGEMSVLALRDNKLTDEEKQRILRVSLAKKKIEQRKRLAESREKLNKVRRNLGREQIYGQAKERKQ